MKFTCLSRGGGYHFPPCHMLNLCGFRVLFDCPLDLSGLVVFSPIHADLCTMLDGETSAYSSCKSLDPKSVETPLDAKNLIHAEPYYRTIQSLHLWNVSFIDIVLISNPMGMLGLPYLTRKKGFSAKIYATEATARLGQIMVEDLVKMHSEFRQFYGPSECFPQWMKWEELEMLPLALQEKVLGKNGADLGGWMPLYSSGDVKDCMQKVQTLKFTEETCHNGTLNIKALSSGLEIGSCNWEIIGPKRNIAYLSSSIFASATAMSFDYQALEGTEMIIYSDFSSRNVMEDAENEHDVSSQANNNLSNLIMMIIWRLLQSPWLVVMKFQKSWKNYPLYARVLLTL